MTARNTFAVLIPTPGSSMSSCIVFGGIPSYFSVKIAQVLKIFEALLLKKEMDFMNSFILGSHNFSASLGCLRCSKNI